MQAAQTLAAPIYVGIPSRFTAAKPAARAAQRREEEVTTSEHPNAAMEAIARCVDAFRMLAASFEPGRNDDPLVNDMFEATDDWRSFGELLLRNGGKGRFPGRVQQEEELHATLQVFYDQAIKNNPDYVRLMELEARLIAEGK